MPEASVFTKIIRGELPARFVWSDDHVVAFLSKWPLRAGHTLVVPRKEVDHWIDLEQDLLHRVMEVAQTIGRGIQRAFHPAKVGMLIGGLDVPHVHIHVSAVSSVFNLDCDRQNTNAAPHYGWADDCVICRRRTKETRGDLA